MAALDVLLNITITLGILSNPALTRVARAATLTFAEREFVTAARALGAGHGRILMRELLPNAGGLFPRLVRNPGGRRHRCFAGVSAAGASRCR